VALGNTGGTDDLAALQKAAADPEPLIAEHASWALREIERRCGTAGESAPTL
jgi:epoxyqueuosine reductase